MENIGEPCLRISGILWRVAIPMSDYDITIFDCLIVTVVRDCEFVCLHV